MADLAPGPFPEPEVKVPLRVRREIAADAVRLAHRLVGEGQESNPFVAMLNVADGIERGDVIL